MKVTVITVVFNQKKHIQSSIDSVLNQTYNNLEYIIIDGDSTDGTIDIIKKYSDKISKYVSEPDQGIYYAMNKGISLATGDIIGFLNADDFYSDKSVIQNVVNAFKENSVDSCYGDILYVKRNDINTITRNWKSGEFSLEKFKYGWFPPHPTFFVKREIYNKYGNFNTDFKFSADVELMIRFLCKHNVSTCYIPDVLIKMRDNGESNRSYLNISKSVWECYKAMRINGINVTYLYILRTLIFRLRQKVWY
jgi:glycosyltransferase